MRVPTGLIVPSSRAVRDLEVNGAGTFSPFRSRCPGERVYRSFQHLSTSPVDAAEQLRCALQRCLPTTPPAESRSRGYCLEMICADFLAGANLDQGDPGTLLFSMMRFFCLLPENQRQAFLESLNEKAS